MACGESKRQQLEYAYLLVLEQAQGSPVRLQAHPARRAIPSGVCCPSELAAIGRCRLRGLASLRSMIALEISGETPAMISVARRVLNVGGVSRVRIIPVLPEGHSLVSGRVQHDATDALLAELQALGVPREDVVLTRVEELGGGTPGAREASLIWTDVVGLAGSNARIFSRYLAFMAAAGVIACYGVVDTNPLLVVGAMAVSPDLLPITAIAVGVIGRSLRLAARALLTLSVGMAVASSSRRSSPSRRANSPCSRRDSTLRTPSCTGLRMSTMRRSRSRSRRVSRGCSRSRRVPAPVWGSRSRSPRFLPPPISASRSGSEKARRRSERSLCSRPTLRCYCRRRLHHAREPARAGTPTTACRINGADLLYTGWMMTIEDRGAAR